MERSAIISNQPSDAVSSGSQSLFLQPAIKRAAAESEALRRLPRVSLKACQRLLNQELLPLLHAHFVQARRPLAARAQAQIIRPDELMSRHQYRALDHVVQFAH